MTDSERDELLDRYKRLHLQVLGRKAPHDARLLSERELRTQILVMENHLKEPVERARPALPNNHQGTGGGIRIIRDPRGL